MGVDNRDLGHMNYRQAISRAFDDEFDRHRVFVDNDIVPVEITEKGIKNNQYSEVSAVAIGATVDLFSYTIPVGKGYELKFIDVDGGNVAEYIVTQGIITQGKVKTYYTKFNYKFTFDKLPMVAGDILKVTVENKSDSVSNYNCNVQGNLYDL